MSIDRRHFLGATAATGAFTATEAIAAPATAGTVPVSGLGVDERTAVVVDASGKGEVMGEGKVYLVKANQKPAVCEAGKPMEFSGLTYHRLSAGDTLAFPSGATSVPAEPISASGGVTIPANPY